MVIITLIIILSGVDMVGAWLIITQTSHYVAQWMKKYGRQNRAMGGHSPSSELPEWYLGEARGPVLGELVGGWFLLGSGSYILLWFIVDSA